MKNVPPNIVPFLIAFLGTVGNIASDTAMVVIPPLAALVYIGVKKNPVVGMIVAMPVPGWFYGKPHDCWYGLPAAGPYEPSH